MLTQDSLASFFLSPNWFPYSFLVCLSDLPTPKIEILDSQLEKSGQILDNLHRCRGYALYQNLSFNL